MTANYGRWANAATEACAVGLLRRMLAIPSPSFQESVLARYVVDAMRDFGFDAHIDAAGNVIGEIGRGDGPTVMLLGHMDTIPGTPPVRTDLGRLYGRGSVDAKGPLATMICAAAAMADLPARFIVAGAVEEETPSSRGAMEIRRTYEAPDALIVGEPSGWNTVVVGYKGKLDLRYSVECPSTHPSNPESKASELGAECWSVLLDELGPETSHSVFERPGATLTSISGDLTSAVAELSVRTPPGFDSESLVARLRRRVPAGELSVVNEVRPCRVSRGNPVARALTAGIREQRARPGMKVKTATSDMNTMAEVWDVPMATYGPGDSKLDHSEDEYIALADFSRAIEVLSSALGELAVSLRGPGDVVRRET